MRAMVAASAGSLPLAITPTFLSNAAMHGEAAPAPHPGASPPDERGTDDRDRTLAGTESVWPAVAALQQGSWRSLAGLSSVPGRAERFLAAAGFDRAPWLAVAFGGGIAAWFILANRWQWMGFIALCLGGAVLVLAALRGGRTHAVPAAGYGGTGAGGGGGVRHGLDQVGAGRHIGDRSADDGYVRRDHPCPAGTAG